MRLGYSFWGFLGPGVTDTPDGGRSHRRPLIDALLHRGHQVAFLQANRDHLEAGDDLGGTYRFDGGFPDIDVLVLEWRWPILDRNTTACGSTGHTCDLHRQDALLNEYTRRQAIPTVIWDKDRRLPADSPWRRAPHVAVCEAALAPSPGAHRLLFPVPDAQLDGADPYVLAGGDRPVPLVYVGNQYNRDDAFDQYFAPAAAKVAHQIAGKWPDTGRWPHINFLGRVPFRDVATIYGSALATVLLLPRRYAEVGQMTQRIFEAVLAGCLPLAPADIRDVATFVPPDLVVGTGEDVIRRLWALQEIAGTARHAELIADCLDRLELFRLSRQAYALESVLYRLTSSVRPVEGAL